METWNLLHNGKMGSQAEYSCQAGQVSEKVSDKMPQEERQLK